MVYKFLMAEWSSKFADWLPFKAAWPAEFSCHVYESFSQAQPPREAVKHDHCVLVLSLGACLFFKGENEELSHGLLSPLGRNSCTEKKIF